MSTFNGFRGCALKDSRSDSEMLIFNDFSALFGGFGFKDSRSDLKNLLFH